MKYLSGVLIFSATLIISACGAEGVSTEQEAEALLGAANPTTDNTQTPAAENIGDTTQNGADTAGTNTETDLVAISAPESTTSDNSASTKDAPIIRFTGTTFDKDQVVGNVILLDGSASFF